METPEVLVSRAWIAKQLHWEGAGGTISRHLKDAGLTVYPMRKRHYYDSEEVKVVLPKLRAASKKYVHQQQLELF